jgi:hypothetical protein
MKGEKITDVLKVYEQKNSMGGLALNWMIYGYSGFEKRPPNGVLASYFKCTINNHVKTIGAFHLFIHLKYVRTYSI